MATVLHYLQTWLPLSEQFVHAAVARSRHQGVVVARMPLENRAAFPYRPVYSLGRLFPGHRAPSVAERRALTAALMLVAARYRPRLVHHHHGYRLRDIDGLVRRMRLPLVVSLHGHDVLAFARQWPDYFAGAFDAASAVVVPSRFLAGQVIDRLGVSADVVRVIPSGVDTEFFSPTPLPDGPPEALFVGRFVERKGVDVLLEAWRQVTSRLPDARLRLLGFGPLQAWLVAQADPSVVVEPTDSDRRAGQLREALRRCRVVVTPSRTTPDGDAETLLLVNLEAQACGRPVVSTLHGGIPEYVEDGVTGVLVPEADAACLADALVAVLSDDGLARRLAEAGPGRAAQFDVAWSTTRLDGLYDGLMAGSPLGAGGPLP
ncbi:MAG TPA: glycosyltransferase [Acidimicrobiales bacterium]|nr:glycosyltransferase [Acidimicrobiales bacterium]